MARQFEEYMVDFDFNPPGNGEALNELQAKLVPHLPLDYVEFMMKSNGGEGGVGQNSYLVLWTVEEIEPCNEGYGVAEFAPGLVVFGSNGGDTAYAFDTRCEEPQIVEVPFIGMDLAEVRPIGRSFVEFLDELIRR